MGVLSDRANGKDPFVINGQLKTTFRRVTGCKKLDREVAKNRMREAGYTQICKVDEQGSSKFSRLWRDFV